MAIGLGFQGGVLGIGEETTWGTKVAPTKFFELVSEGISVEEERLHSESIPQIFTDEAEVTLGSISVSGEAEFETRYEGIETVLKHALGEIDTSFETASFVIAEDANDMIDFIEDDGAEISVQIPAGTYKLGTIHTEAGTLCAVIKNLLETGDGTYKVWYDTSVKKVKITVLEGDTEAIQLLGATGSNLDVSALSTLGFDAVDTSLVAEAVANNVVQPIYTHTFKLTDALPTGLTVEVDKDTTAFTVEGSKINTLAMTVDYGGFLKTKIGIIGEDLTSGNVTSPTLSTSPLINFTQGAVTYSNGAVSVKQISFTLNNNLSTDRRFIGSRTIAEPQRTKKIEVNGTVQIEFDGLAQYNDFRAATSRALILTFTGEDIKTDLPYFLIINFPVVKLTQSMPKFNGEGVMTLDMPFKAYATSESSREMNIVLRNRIYIPA